MRVILNEVISNEPQDILADVYYPENSNGKLVIFCHGFKGFKDWGSWHLVAENFAKKGFIFVKFNFSGNGVGTENMENFTRLDLFLENNYSKEIQDVQTVLNWVENAGFFGSQKFIEIDLIGHSRGGGIALYTAANDERVDKVATWASIGNFNRFGTSETIQKWKDSGVRNFYNGRTRQNMEIGYQFYEDYLENQQDLDLEKCLKKLNKPTLLIHGTADDAVGFSHAQRMKQWSPNAKLVLMENANHVFGASHPFIKKSLPADLYQIVDSTIDFFST